MLGELVPQRQGRGREQDLPVVIYLPARAWPVAALGGLGLGGLELGGLGLGGLGLIGQS
jgi:hypothetical protein